MNPAPDAEVTSVGEANFEWIVQAMAELVVRKAHEAKSGSPQRASQLV